MSKKENIRAYMREIICPKCQDKRPCVYQTNSDEDICPKFAESVAAKYEDDNRNNDSLIEEQKTMSKIANLAVEEAANAPTPENAVNALIRIVECIAMFEAIKAKETGGRTYEDCIKSARWYLKCSTNEHDVVNAFKQIMIAMYLLDGDEEGTK